MVRRLGGVVFACGAAIAVSCVVKPADEPQPPPPRATAPPPAKVGGSPYGGSSYGGLSHAQAVTYEDITDTEGNTYRVTQGVRGEPAVVGCADGQREAFVHAGQFPTVAGCLAAWTGAMSLRAPPTGAACGDDAGACAAPADACATGWHLCGATGAVAELRTIAPEQCATAGGGRFSAAVSHCTAQSGCSYDYDSTANYPCFERGWCSEAVCCGADCGQFGSCRDGIWKQATHIARGTDQGCAATTSRRAGGVLCCRG